MSKFKLTAVLAVVAALGTVGAAQAQTLSLSSSSVTGGAISFDSVGTLNLSQTTSIDCNVSVSGTVSGAPGSAALSGVSRSMSGGLCYFPIVYPLGTWSVTAVSASDQTVNVWFSANTIANKPCAGSATLTLDLNLYIDLNNVKIPAVNAGDPDCYITGTLEASQPVYIL